METMITHEVQVTQEVVTYLRQVRYIATRQKSRQGRFPAECRVSFRDGSGEWVDVPYALGQLLLTTAVNALGRVGYVDWPARNSDERYANWDVHRVYEQRVASAVPVQMEYMVEMGRFDFGVWEARLCPYCRRPLIWCTCDYRENAREELAQLGAIPAIERLIDSIRAQRELDALCDYDGTADAASNRYGY